MKRNLFFISALLSLIFSSCVQEKSKSQSENKTIIIREQADATTLNPVGSGDRLSVYLSFQIYQSLIGIDYKTAELVGILAEDEASITQDAEGNMLLSYSIRPEAKFDNGRSITVEDVLFSLKLNICPLVNNMGGPHYYDFIDEVIFSDVHSKSFSFKCNDKAVLNLFRSGDFSILPYEVYDSSRILKNYALIDLKNNKELEDDENIIEFARAFNDKILSSNSNLAVGSGAYELEKWEKNERIVLKKKAAWWGHDLRDENSFFIANANRLQYEIINDGITALTALKSSKVDFMNDIPSNNWDNVKENENLTTETIAKYGYSYLGFNLNNQLLSQLEVRQAIASALPLNDIIKTVFNDHAVVNRLPLPLQMKKLRNDTIKFSPYNLEASKEILKNSNWEDSDNNGILDKVIEGKQMELKFNYHYNTGNEGRKSIGLILKNELKKIGIELNVTGLEWTSYLKKLRGNEADLFVNGLSSAPIPPDFTGTFHSKSANGGRNYANYQNPKADSLIEAMNIEQNEEKRIHLIYTFQEIIAQDMPYLILLTKMERIAYSNQLKSVNIYPQRPHFWAPELN